jgi:hypothetical protein
MFLFSFFKAILLKPKMTDFSAQFDKSCVVYKPDSKTCEKHGPIKFIREDFGGCKECNDKWRKVVYPNINLIKY